MPNIIAGIDFDPKTKLYFPYIETNRIRNDVSAGEKTREEARRVLEEYCQKRGVTYSIGEE